MLVRTRRKIFTTRAFTLAVAACFSGIAAANPVAPKVMSGHAVFNTVGRTLTVTNTPGTIIHWDSFSIGRGELTRFNQVSAASTVLNRVTGRDPSAILGSLRSNGKVFLINPNGVVFGAGARIDVGGLVVSSLALSDADFAAGKLKFRGTGNEGAVVNHGRIHATGGPVFLVAPHVENSGLISTPGGDLLLAAGRSVEIVDADSPHIRVEVEASGNEALNLGRLVANGGRVAVYGGLVRNAGRISADAVQTENGRVFLRSTQHAGAVLLQASDELRLEDGSRISANGVTGGTVAAHAGGTLLAQGAIEALGSSGSGGQIRLTGERVAVLNRARLDASGERGGGEILVGGDVQGGNAEVRNAERAYVAAGAQLRADAIGEGDGGKVVVWADGDTRFHGAISAKGGARAGDGGFVEVSGKQDLEFLGAVDVGAANGRGGKVLLDPQNIVLNATVQPAPPDNGAATPDLAFADAPAAGTYTIQVGDVTGYSELFLQATNDITLSSALTMGAGNSVRFEANNNININAALTVSGAGSIVLKADADASGAGTLAISQAITARAGGIELSGASVTSTAPAGTVSATGAGNAAAGNVSITASGAISMLGAISATGGAATAGNPGSNGGAVTLTGATVTTGSIAASGSTGSGTDQAGGNAGAVSITATGAVSAGAITVQAGAGTGMAAGGAAGSLTVSGANVALGNLNLAGNNNAHGGTVDVDAGGTLSVGTIGTSGGAALTGTAGRNAGSVNLDAVGGVTTGAITASGTNGFGTNQAGGNAAAITIANSGSGNVSTGALASRNGNATGTGAGGVAGDVNVTNTAAAGNVSVAALTTTGGTLGHGGNISVSALGSITGTGAINAAGGTTITGNAGRNAGSVTLSAGAGISLGTNGITATGSAGLGTNQAGGNAGAVSVTATGVVTTGALAAQAGAGVGTAAGGVAGSLTLTGADVTLGNVTLAGNNNAHGGTVSVDATGALSVGTIATGGGAALTGTAGRNAGSVSLDAGGAVAVSTITASGSSGLGTSQSGGNAGAVSITGMGGVGTAAITASGGSGAATNANGGNAGVIAVANSGTGNVSAGALSSRNGNAAGTGTAGAVGGVSVTNTAVGGDVSVGALATNGATLGHGGNILISALGSVAGTGTISSAGGTTLTGNAGRNAGNVTLNAGGGINLGTNSVTASGSAGIGTNQAGGNAGVVTITGAGAVSAGAIAAQAGGGTGVAAGGTASSLTVAGGNVALGNLTLAGNGNAHGGALDVDAAGTLSAGTITTAGGTAVTGTAGRNAGSVSLDAGAAVTVGTITASGSSGLGTSQAGGHAGAVSVTGVGGVTVGAIAASGGNGTATNANGGNAGVIAVANSGTGNVSAGALSSRNGNAAGTGTAGNAGGLVVVNTAGDITVGALATTGGTLGHGGNISLDASGSLTVTGAVGSGGGTTITGNAGRNAGSVTLSAGNGINLGLNAIVASGSAGLGTNQAGGNAAAVTLQGGAGALTLGSITAMAGARTGSGALGTNGTVRLGTSATATQSGGIVAGDLVLEGAGGSHGLRNAANAVQTIAADTGSVDYAQAGALIVGTVGGVVGVTGTGVVQVETTGAASNLTLNNTVASTAAGDAVIVKAGSANAAGVATGGRIVNLAGASGLFAPNGRYLAYSGDPSTTTEGTTGYAKRYNTEASYVPGGSGSMFLYRVAPSLTLTANNKSRIYGDANPVFDGTATGFIDGDTAAGVGVDFSSTAVFNTPVSASPVAITGLATNSENYTLIFVNGQLTITQRALTIGAAAANKVYDGTTAASVAYTDDRVAGDSLSFSGTATFGDKNVGAGKAVSVTGVGLGGADAGNYTYNTTAASTADITPRALTVGATAANKVYDGNTTASVTLGDDRIAGDVLSSSHAGALFADKNAGLGKVVSVTGIAVTGADAGNYTFNTSATAAADITPRALTVGASAANKVYDGTTAASVAYTDNRVAGDALTVSGTATFADKNVGVAKAVSVVGIGLGGADAGNYVSNTTASSAADVTPRALTVSASASNKVYDGNVAAAVAHMDDRIAGDVLAISSAAAFADKNVGAAKAVSVTGISVTGADAGNYTYNTTASSAADITPRALTVGATGQNRVYDGTTAATVSLSDDRIAGDVLSSSYAGAAFADKNVGTGKTVSVSGIGLTGADAANYSFNTSATATADVTPRALTVGATASGKVYDGTTAASVAFTDNRVAGDALSLSGTAAFADKNAGVAKAVSVTAIGVTGADAGNYTHNTTASSAADITPRTITVSATGIDKVYDATTAASVLFGDNRVAGDVLAASGSAAFADANAGAAKAVTVTGIALSGADAANYALSGTLAVTTATITPAALVVRANDASRLVSQPNPAFSATYLGLRGTDTPASLGGALLLAAPGTGVPAGTYGIVPSGVVASNYNVSYVPGTLTVLTVPAAAAADPLATAQPVQQAMHESPFFASSAAVFTLPAGSVSEFLNRLPAPAAGGAASSSFAGACGARTPLAVLRCGPAR